MLGKIIRESASEDGVVERSIKQVKRWNKGEVVEWSAYCGCEKERCCVDLAMPHDKIKKLKVGRRQTMQQATAAACSLAYSGSPGGGYRDARASKEYKNPSGRRTTTVNCSFKNKYNPASVSCEAIWWVGVGSGGKSCRSLLLTSQQWSPRGLWWIGWRQKKLKINCLIARLVGGKKIKRSLSAGAVG